MPITPPGGGTPSIQGPSSQGPNNQKLSAVNAAIIILKETIKNLEQEINSSSSFSASTASITSQGVRDYDKLITDGVTCNKLPNGLIFPSGGLQGWGTSEGMGNWMRDALKNGDTKLFQSLLNSYFHVCRQASDHMGLMPWSIDKNGQALDKGSATDADEDIIAALIDAVAQDPNMTMTDTDGTTMKVSEMLKQAITNFTQLDCGSANGLTGGSTKWTLGAGFTDYLDLAALTKMMNYCEKNGMSDQAAILKNSMNSMMNYVKNELGLPGNFKLPSSQGDGSSAIARLLYRMAEFIASPLSASNPDLRKDAISIVQNLLTKGFDSGAIRIADSQWGKTIQMTTPGSYTLSNAQASATLYMAMKLLNDKGLLPSNLTSKLPDVKTAFDNDMNNQFNNLQSETPSEYSNNGNYFGLTLGILCESLIKEYS